MMRFSQAEKMEIIRLVEGSSLPARHTLRGLGVPRSSFYRWYARYAEAGEDGLASQPPHAWRFWNKIPESEKQRVVEITLEKPELTPRELAWHITDSHGAYISESSVYRIRIPRDHDLVASPAYIVLSAADQLKHKTSRVHELWQTDSTYFKIIGWGWYYLSTILDDMTQGKSERYQRTMKNVINLDHYYLPWPPEHQIRTFVVYYNHHRVRESLDNLTPADIYQGRAVEIVAARNLVKEQTSRARRRLNLGLMPLNKGFIRPAELREVAL